MKAEVIAYRDTYYTWVDWYPEPEGPPAPSVDAAAEILTGLGIAFKPMMVTLMWDAPVDLDLHYSCGDGTPIYYGNSNNQNCGGTLDADMQASNYGNIRGDGVQG